jgi:hypothetical protein
MSMSKRAAVLLAGASMGLMLLGACAEQAAELRKHTYPPDFQYITQDQLQMTMWQLAALTHQLDAMAAQPEHLPAQRFELIQLLTQLERAADDLKAEGVPSNHPLLNAHLDDFRDDIRAARLDVSREPPSFRRASRLTGACVYCHGT